MLAGGATAAAKHADRALAAAGGDKQASSQDSGGKGSTDKDIKEEAAKLLKHKTVAKFTTMDRLEASFPMAAVKQAEARSKAAKTGTHAFFNKAGADADLKDAAASYGKHNIKSVHLPGQTLVQQHQAATAALAAAELAAGGLSAGPAATGAEALGDRKSVFITQRATAGGADAAAAGQNQTPGSGFSTSRSNQGRSSSPSRGGSPHRLTIAGATAGGGGTESSKPNAAADRSRRTTVTLGGTSRQPRSTLQDNSAAGSALNSVAGSQLVDYSALGSAAASDGSSKKPDFGVLTELTQQAPGEVNPVTDWHNDFVKTRHAGYTALQEALWQRSQQRAATRSDPAGRAAFNKTLMEHLDMTQSKLTPGWIPGTTVESPFVNSNKSKAATAAAAADGQAAAGTRAIKQSEVELLEHFYDALCGLVEKQRLSDPLSLTVVHQVKALLEGGTFLQPPLLQQVVDKTADFVKSCGLVRYNRFALPLLTFIRKCVGVSAADLQAMAAAAGISKVLYEPQQQQQRAQSPGRAAGLQVAVNSAAEGPADGDKAGAPGSPRSPARAGPTRTDSRTLNADHGSISPRHNSAVLAAAEQGGTSMRRDSKTGGAADASLSPSMVRRNSRLESTALRDAPVPPIPIDAAMAAAANDIAVAVHSAPQSLRAGTGSEGGPGRVRIPGVAGHIEAMQQHADAAAAGMAALRPPSLSGKAEGLSGSIPAPQLDIAAADAEVIDAADADDLPDLGEDDAGQPLSRRVRNEEGNLSWREGRQQTAAVAVDDGRNAGAETP
eukprot:GHUV01020310.1.p1 GENE.GHUV01020310.1~~GHUV01020310.1.p1  ORF type:complete len:781 (+),score=290.42 GHUV01020310.1:1618-3960(+)